MAAYPEVELELNVSNRNIDFVEDGYDPVSYTHLLITGASRGLGKHGALALAAKGVDLIITYRSQAAEAEAVVTQARALDVYKRQGRSRPCRTRAGRWPGMRRDRPGRPRQPR